MKLRKINVKISFFRYSNRHQFFCKLTWRHINKEPHHIMKHITGKRFKRAYLHCKFVDDLKTIVILSLLGQECQANGTEYTPIGRRKKKQQKMNGDDDDQYEDLSDDEVVVEDEDDDLSDLYPGEIDR